MGAHLLFLTPYSPDLNLLKQLFANLKHLLRATGPRDIEQTWRKVGELLDLFGAGVSHLPQELRLCFRVKTSMVYVRNPGIFWSGSSLNGSCG